MTRTQLIKSTQMSTGGGLTKILEDLLECGFIMKTTDIDKKQEDRLSIDRFLYVVLFQIFDQKVDGHRRCVIAQ